MSECRICKETNDEPENPLISPCNCIGSVGKVHLNCVDRWVLTSNNNKCNICNSLFTQRVEYNGPLSRSLVEYLTDREKTLSMLLTIASLLFTISTLSGAVFNKLWGYFIMSPLTFTKLAMYKALYIVIFTSIGILVSIGRQITFRFNNTQVRFDVNNLVLPVSNLFAIIEFIIATHHTKHTGWTLPVILMYYSSVYKLSSTIFFDDFLGWYRKQYFKRIFINNPELLS